MPPLKIVLIGPCKSGKTTIANYLSNMLDTANDDYRPTAAIRILDLELKIEGKEIEITLWDCSGDKKYEKFWPVFMWNAHGIVLVYDPEDTEKLSELDVFYHHFIGQNIIPRNNALICAHYKDMKPNHPLPSLSGPMSNIFQISANVLENGDDLKKSFKKYINNVLNDVKHADQDGLSIFNMIL